MENPLKLCMESRFVVCRIVALLLIIAACTNAQCPFPCSCTGVTVDCWKKGFTSAPTSYPPNTEILDLSLNSISNLQGTEFDGLRNMLSLKLQGNSISSLPVGIFKDLARMETLGLHINRLPSLANNPFAGLRNLKTL
ncbi:slit homolog 2 protein-like [Sycon ciliatum]|uniref:slit homolog 2 protein-like n=1 Tax=Sycon ciliatum TaxID=27933 RepID=UPI0031F64F55